MEVKKSSEPAYLVVINKWTLTILVMDKQDTVAKKRQTILRLRTYADNKPQHSYQIRTIKQYALDYHKSWTEEKNALQKA